MTVHSRISAVLVKRSIPEIYCQKGSKCLPCYCVQWLGVLSWRTLALIGKRWNIILIKHKMPAPCMLCTASQRTVSSCCGSSQPQEGTWLQLYRLDKALFSSHYPWDRVQQDLCALESVSHALPGCHALWDLHSPKDGGLLAKHQQVK